MLAGGKKTVYKSSISDGELIIKSKLAREEIINPREWELLSSGSMRGIMKVKKGSFNRLIFTAPESEPLKRFLMQGLTKEEFASVLAQLVRVLMELDQYALQMCNLELHIESVYITPRTRELIFIYRPVMNKESCNNLNGFIRSLIEYTTFSTLQDRAYVAELESILRDIEKFPPKTMSDYVCRLDKATYDRELSWSTGEDQPTQMQFDQMCAGGMRQEKQGCGKIDPEHLWRSYDSRGGGIDESTGLYEVYDGFDVRSGERAFGATHESTGYIRQRCCSAWEEAPTSVGDDEELTAADTTYTSEDIGSCKKPQPQDSNSQYEDPLTGVWEEPEEQGYSEDPPTSAEYEPLEIKTEPERYCDDLLTDFIEGPQYKQASAKPYGSAREIRSAGPRVLATLERCSTGEVYAIKQDEILIGKDRLGADIYIDGNPAVSRRHALITEHAGKFYITDMRSLNHTFVNGRELRAEQEFEIKDGSRLCLADENFIFRIR